ncbi:unnamed protein product, partial [Prorocentrum cordatum]
ALESLRLGTRVLAFYDREDNYWHERVLVGRITPTRWVVVTPHFDIYGDDFSEALRLCLVGPLGGLPTKLPGQVLRMDWDRFRRNEEQLLSERKELACEIRREEGLPEEPLALAPLPAPEGYVAERVDPGAGLRWVVLEFRAGDEPGDELPAGTTPVCTSGYGVIVELAVGTKLAVGSHGALEGTATPRYRLWGEVYADRLREHEAGLFAILEPQLGLMSARYSGGRNGGMEAPWPVPNFRVGLLLAFNQRPLYSRSVAKDQRLLEGIASLNELGWQGRFAPSRAPLTAAQRAAARRLATTYGEWSPPAIGAGKVVLLEILRAGLQSKLGTGRGLLRSPVEAATLVRDAGAPRAMDPKLGGLGYDCGYAMGELLFSGVIEASSEP